MLKHETTQDRQLAEELFAKWLSQVEEGADIPLETLLSAHPSLAELIRALHDDWRSFAPLLSRVVPGALSLDSLSPSTHGGDTDQAQGLDAELLLELGIATPDAARYRFRSVLGRGGGGLVLNVWDARLRRPLAMKFILGRDNESGQRTLSDVDPRALSRFIEEARIASALDHPGIVPVYELGSDDSGRAYFTMKLVRGESLATLLAQIAPGQRDARFARALDVLVRVCEAVAYAHDRGVVHRDLKPANVMVGAYGEVYVVDWGLARLLQRSDDLDEREHVPAQSELEPILRSTPTATRTGDVAGTPYYMSPEQARGEINAVGPRSDVYAIGALLYQLLTGQPPYAAESRDTSALEIVERARAGAPREVESLAPDAEPELLAICQRAMQRDPDRRYSSAGELADELRAFQQGHVVRAHQAGHWTRLRKWVRRNQALASAIAALGAAIVLGSSFSVRYAREAHASEKNAEQRAQHARQQEQVARESEQQARSNAQRAEQIQQFLERTLVFADPSRARTDEYRVSDVMDSAIESLRKGELGDDALTGAQIRLTIAVVLINLSRCAEGLELAHAARELLASGFAPDHPQIVRAHSAIAGALNGLGRNEEAAEHLGLALALVRGAVDPDPAVEARLLYELGSVHRARGRFEDALAVYRESFDRYAAAPGDNASSCAGAMEGQAMSLSALGRAAEAVQLLREGLELRRKNAPDGDSSVLLTLTNLGDALRWSGELHDALACHQEAYDLSRSIFHRDHQFALNACAHLGGTLTVLGRFEEGIRAQLEGLEMAQRMHPGDHSAIAASLNGVAEALEASGDALSALPYYDGALAMRRRLFPQGHSELAKSENNLGGCLYSLGLMQPAYQHYHAGLTMLEALYPGDNHYTAIALNNVGRSLLQLDRPLEALEFHQRALDMRRRLFGERALPCAESLGNLGNTLSRMRRYCESSEARLHALEIHRAATGELHPGVAIHSCNYAFDLEALGYAEESIEHATRGAEIARSTLPPGHPQRRALESLAEAVIGRARARLSAR